MILIRGLDHFDRPRPTHSNHLGQRKRNEERDLRLRSEGPAAIRSATGKSPSHAERLPPVAIANFPNTSTGLFAVSNPQFVVLMSNA